MHPPARYRTGKKAFERRGASLYPEADFCTDPGIICRDDFPELRWVSGLFFWMDAVQSYDARGATYLDALTSWVNNGADVSDTSLIDFTSGVVNRGHHDAPLSAAEWTRLSSIQPDSIFLKNGPVHGVLERRSHFVNIIAAMARVVHLPGKRPPSPAPPPAPPPAPELLLRVHLVLVAFAACLGVSFIYLTRVRRRGEAWQLAARRALPLARIQAAELLLRVHLGLVAFATCLGVSFIYSTRMRRRGGAWQLALE